MYIVDRKRGLEETSITMPRILGVTGLTGILGIREKAHIVPGNNQTVVVSEAAEACGTAAGQVAKMLAISILKYTLLGS